MSIFFASFCCSSSRHNVILFLYTVQFNERTAIAYYTLTSMQSCLYCHDFSLSPPGPRPRPLLPLLLHRHPDRSGEGLGRPGAKVREGRVRGKGGF